MSGCIPPELLQCVEGFGGLIVKRDLERGARGWVLPAEIFVHGEGGVVSLVFAFATREQAESCRALCSRLPMPDYNAVLGIVTAAEDFYRCSFCHAHSKDNGELLRRCESAAAICEGCLRELYAELAARGG